MLSCCGIERKFKQSLQTKEEKEFRKKSISCFFSNLILLTVIYFAKIISNKVVHMDCSILAQTKNVFIQNDRLTVRYNYLWRRNFMIYNNLPLSDTHRPHSKVFVFVFVHLVYFFS